MTMLNDDNTFRTLIEGALVPIAVNDEAGNVTYLNAAFIQKFGYTQSDIPTVDMWWPLAYPDEKYRSQIKEAWLKRLNDCNKNLAMFVPFEVELRIKNGETLTVIVTSSPIQKDGKTLFLITFIDITDRKRAELALKRSEESLNLALSAAEMSMWSFDLLSGEPTLCDRWYRMLGYEKAEIAVNVTTWQKLIHPDDAHSVELSLAAHLNGDSQIFHAEFRLRHKDSHWVWMQSRGKIIERDINGLPLRMAGTNFDISDRKRLAIEGRLMLQKIEALIQNLGAVKDENDPSQTGNLLELLTDRQRKVLELIALGYTSTDIAHKLGISASTAVTHRRNLMKNLNLHSTAEITRFAIKHKLIAS